MPDFVLAQMRRTVVKGLRKASERYTKVDDLKGVWRAFEMGESSETALVEGVQTLQRLERMGNGAVLYLGHGPSQNEGGHPASSTLPEFVTLPQTDSKVPVFDLTRLLSPVDLEEIRAVHPRFQNSALFYRPADPETVEAMLTLWKLNGFVKGD